MRVQVFVSEWVEMKRSVIQRIEKCQSEGLCVCCMQPFVEGEKIVRGVHERCRQATERAIRKGLYTEKQRIAEGKLLAKSESGRKPTNPATVDAVTGSY